MSLSFEATVKQAVDEVERLPRDQVLAALVSKKATNKAERKVALDLLGFFSATLHDNEDPYHIDASLTPGASLREFVASSRPTLEYLAANGKTVADRAKACDLLWAGLPPSRERAQFGINAASLLTCAGDEQLSSAELLPGVFLLLRAYRVAQSVTKSPSHATEHALSRLAHFFQEAFKRGAYVACHCLLEGIVDRGAPRSFLEELWVIASAEPARTETSVLEALARRLQKTDELRKLVEVRLSHRLARLLGHEKSGGDLLGLSVQYEELAKDAQVEGCGEVDDKALEGYQRTSNAAMEAAPISTVIPPETILPRLHALSDEIDRAAAPDLGQVFMSAAALISTERAAETSKDVRGASPLMSIVDRLSSNSDGRRRVRAKGNELELAMDRLHLDMTQHGAVLLRFLKAARVRTDWDSDSFVEVLVARAPNIDVRRDLSRRALRAYFRLDLTGALAFGIPAFEALLRDEVVGRGRTALSTKSSGVMDDTMGPLLAELEACPGRIDRDLLFTARVLLAEPLGPNLRNDHCHGNLASYDTFFSVYFGWVLCKLLASEASWRSSRQTRS